MFEMFYIMKTSYERCTNLVPWTFLVAFPITRNSIPRPLEKINHCFTAFYRMLVKGWVHYSDAFLRTDGKYFKISALIVSASYENGDNNSWRKISKISFARWFGRLRYSMDSTGYFYWQHQRAAYEPSNSEMFVQLNYETMTIKSLKIILKLCYRQYAQV